MLDVVNLACARGDRLLFRELSFALQPGELLHVLGPNGSGKTTLLRTLCGLTRPAAGTVQWRGRPTGEDREAFQAELCFIGHHNALNGELTGAENLGFESCLAGRAARPAPDALAELGLGRVATLPTKLLSQGQKRRTALARLLVHSNTLWVLDEPLTALDVRSTAWMLELFARHLAGGGMILLTSHQEVVLPGRAVRTLALEGA